MSLRLTPGSGGNHLPDLTLPAQRVQGIAHGLHEAPLLSAAWEGHALVDDVQPGRAERSLRQVTDIGLDRDHVLGFQSYRAGHQIRHESLERLASALRLGLEVDE